MNNSTHESLENKIHLAVHSIEPDPEFSDSLLKQIMEQPHQPTTAPRRVSRLFSPRPLWAAGSLLGIALMALMLVGPSRVMAAIQSLLVYIPGIGFVQNGDGTLYLDKPLSTKRDGVTLTVDQVVADQEHTVVAYHFDNLPQSSGRQVCVYDDNRLRLPDGKIRRPIGGGLSGAEARIEYQPLVAGVNHFTLLVAMDSKDPFCTAPSEWSVDLTLGSIPPQVTLMPVYEGEDIQTQPQPQTAVPATVSSTPVAQSAAPINPADIQFSIDRVAVLQDGYLVAGHTLWNSQDWEYVSVFPDSLHISDADGKEVPFEAADVSNQDGGFSYKIKGKNFRSPLTLKVDSVVVNGSPAKAFSFSFDTGKDPQIGQSWTLNQDMDVLGIKFTIHSVKLEKIEGDSSFSGAKTYAFEIKTDPQLHNIDFKYSGEQKIGGWGAQSRDLPDGTKLLEISYPDGIPTGSVNYQVGHMMFNLTGTWQAEWQLPAAAQP
jgi:hypothetical protein